MELDTLSQIRAKRNKKMFERAVSLLAQSFDVSPEKMIELLANDAEWEEKKEEAKAETNGVHP